MVPKPSLLAGELESFNCTPISQFNGDTVTHLVMRLLAEARSDLRPY